MENNEIESDDDDGSCSESVMPQPCQSDQDDMDSDCCDPVIESEDEADSSLDELCSISKRPRTSHTEGLPDRQVTVASTSVPQSTPSSVTDSEAPSVIYDVGDILKHKVNLKDLDNHQLYNYLKFHHIPCTTRQYGKSSSGKGTREKKENIKVST